MNQRINNILKDVKDVPSAKAASGPLNQVLREQKDFDEKIRNKKANKADIAAAEAEFGPKQEALQKQFIEEMIRVAVIPGVSEALDLKSMPGTDDDAPEDASRQTHQEGLRAADPPYFPKVRPMPISFACGQCGKDYLVSDGLAGKRAKCKACNHRMTIPGTPAAAIPTAGGSGRRLARSRWPGPCRAAAEPAVEDLYGLNEAAGPLPPVLPRTAYAEATVAEAPVKKKKKKGGLLFVEQEEGVVCPELSARAAAGSAG